MGKPVAGPATSAGRVGGSAGRAAGPIALNAPREGPPASPDADRALSGAVARLLRELDDDRLPALALARRDDDLAGLREAAAAVAADDVLVLGTGGASLAGQALAALGDAGGARLHFLDNVDPVTWTRTLAGLDPARSHVLAISSSGATAETLAQSLLALDWLRGAGPGGAGGRFTAVTREGDRPLRRLAREENARAIAHPATVDGRYSALTVVGLLPAMVAGLDARAVRHGAAVVLDDLARDGPASGPAGGTRAILAGERSGASVQVLMPYADRLRLLARWWAQLWGESLGKDGRGSTPVVAAGAVDQHSQLQLWRDGPKRHMVTVIEIAGTVDTPAVATGDADLGYLNGRSLGALLAAQCRATRESLAAAGVPVRSLAARRADEATMGAFFAWFMIETILTAHVNGVDPFGQPAVEDGKRRARAILGRAAS